MNPDWELKIKLWIKDSEEEDVAEMAQEIANGLEEFISLEKAFQGIPDSKTSGLLNVSYQQAFYYRREEDESL